MVRTTGPGLPRPGARMLVANGRRAVGSVSGGCLEQDIRVRARLYGPAGLSIHPETPEEMALSIVAEIQAVMHGRRGGPSASTRAAFTTAE